MLRKTINNSGDTIVEVLIAIAIAGLAIGTSYAIANKSLQRAITARERNEALNIAESQITALKLRYKADPITFVNNNPSIGFVADSNATPSTFPYTDGHFCLNALSTGVGDMTNPWTRRVNNINDTNANNLVVGGTGYNNSCRTKGDTAYFVDIAAQITATSNTSSDRTVYRVVVRWADVATSQINQSIIYYRL